MKKLIVFLSVIFSGVVHAQSDLTFYHMGGITPQSISVNPSYFPDAEAYFSFPIISGTSLNANLGATYNDLMTPIAGTDSVKVDLNKFLGSVSEGDNISLVGDVSLFHFGIKARNKYFSLFANLKYRGSFLYPVQFLDYFVNGNGAFIGQQVEETI